MKDNYEETLARVATTLTHLTVLMNISEHDRRYLEVVDGKLVHSSNYFTIGGTRIRNYTDGDTGELVQAREICCTLYVKIVSDDERIEDAQGSRWSRYYMECDVTWPSYGHSELKDTKERLDIMNQLMEVALKITEKFKDAEIFEMVSTVEERAAARKRDKELVLENQIRSLVTSAPIRKKMQVGSKPRPIHTEDLDIPDGVYQTVCWGQTYEVSIQGTSSSIRRIV